jgi:hypothetical protein
MHYLWDEVLDRHNTDRLTTQFEPMTAKDYIKSDSDSDETEEAPLTRDNVVPFVSNIDAPRSVVTVMVPHFNYIAAGPPDDTEGEGGQWSEVVMISRMAGTSANSVFQMTKNLSIKNSFK